MSNRRAKRREARAQLRAGLRSIPLPAHPYRDSALFYGFLSACLVGIASVTGAGVMRGLIVGACFFVAGTLFSWWRFRARLRREEAGQ